MIEYRHKKPERLEKEKKQTKRRLGPASFRARYALAGYAIK